MGETLCKVCGYRGTGEETACPECGAPLFPAEQAPAPAEVQVTAGEKRERKQKKNLSGKAMLARRAAWLLLVCLAVQGLGLWSLSWQREENDWSAVWGSDLITPRGVWKLGGMDYWALAGDSRHPHKILRSMDWLLSSQYTPDRDLPALSYYDGHTLTKTDWQAGTISADGKVLFYLKSEGEDMVLYRQDLSRGPAREVDRARGNAGLGITSAWDGSAAVWLSGPGPDGQRRSLRQWDRKGGGRDLGYQEDENIYWLGKDGDSALLLRTVPVPGGGDWTSTFYLRWGQEERELDIGGRDQMPVMDRELTQALYSDGEGRYWYEERGREPVAVTGLADEVWLAPLVPQGDGFNVTPTYSARHLTDWVYYGGDQHLYYLDDDLKATDLTPDWQARDYLIDREGSVLYCSSGSGGLYRMDRPGPRGTWTQLDERGGWELNAAPDLSVVGYTTWQDGKQTQGLWDTRTGERTVLGPESRDGALCWLKGGARWRVDGQNGLWFWAPGEKEERQVSLGHDEDDKDKQLTGTGSGPGLGVVGDGSQAVLRLGMDGAYRNGEDGRVIYGGVDRGREYWLLDNAGNATRLETLPAENG